MPLGKTCVFENFSQENLPHSPVCPIVLSCYSLKIDMFAKNDVLHDRFSLNFVQFLDKQRSIKKIFLKYEKNPGSPLGVAC